MSVSLIVLLAFAYINEKVKKRTLQRMEFDLAVMMWLLKSWISKVVTNDKNDAGVTLYDDRSTTKCNAIN